MKFSFKLSPKTIFIGVVILVVVIYIGYVLYRRYYAETYLQFSPGNETAFLMDGVEDFQPGSKSQSVSRHQVKYHSQETQMLRAKRAVEKAEHENFTQEGFQEAFTPSDAQDYPADYMRPFGESSGTISFGRYGSSFIV